jgi:hypothetical protein
MPGFEGRAFCHYGESKIGINFTNSYLSQSLILREKCRLSVFENMVLRRILGSKREEVTGSGEDYITRSFVLCTAHQIFFG